MERTKTKTRTKTNERATSHKSLISNQQAPKGRWEDKGIFKPRVVRQLNITGTSSDMIYSMRWHFIYKQTTLLVKLRIIYVRPVPCTKKFHSHPCPFKTNHILVDFSFQKMSSQMKRRYIILQYTMTWPSTKKILKIKW